MLLGLVPALDTRAPTRRLPSVVFTMMAVITNTPKMNQTVKLVKPLQAAVKPSTTPKTDSRMAPSRPVAATGSVSQIQNTMHMNRMPSDMMP